MAQETHDEVAHLVRTEPGRLQGASVAGVLALLSAAALSAAALAPMAAAVAGGTGVMTALAGVAGNLGGGYLGGVMDRAVNRLRGKDADPLTSGVVRDAVAAELRDALEKDDFTARALSAELTSFAASNGVFSAALTAARGDLRDHLKECFAELEKQQQTTLKRLDAIEGRQRHQGRLQRHHGDLLDEIVDRSRRWDRSSETSREAPGAAPSAAVGHMVVYPPTPATAPDVALWCGGAEVKTGDRIYQIHDDLLEERFSPDHSFVRRQARGLQLVPTRRVDGGYVWLRQVEAHRDEARAQSAVQALAHENDLLRSLGSAQGFPKVHKFVPGSRSATLVTGWPTLRSRAPCDTLADLLGGNGTPLDAWRVFRLCTGLAGLCTTLAKLHDKKLAHRNLIPAGIIMLDDGRLVLRDLGLATRDPEPGEGPADYQAPEQRRRSYQRPGPHTDVHQLSAVAYHLLVGRRPDAALPLPVRAQAPQVPERIGRALDSALTQAPNGRPHIRSLGATFRAARNELS